MAARKRSKQQQYDTSSKRRKVANPFVDDAAAEGSDEESDVGSEAENNNNNQNVRLPGLQQRSRPAFFDKNEEIDEEYFKARYGDVEDDGDDDAEDDDDDTEDDDGADIEAEEEEFFDRPEDGEKWWVLRCKRPATQKELMKRLEGFKDIIRKMVVPSTVTGFIYVHAPADCYIKQAVGHRPVTVTMVQPSEVRQVLRMEKPKNESFTWGRVKVGTYKGDLAEVIRKVDHGKVLVKLVPRVDLAQVAENLGNGKSKSQGKKPKPERKFINWDEFKRLGLGFSRSKQGTRVIAGTSIEVQEEYVVKTIALRNLTKVTPTIPELERFKGRVDLEGCSRTKEQFAVTDNVVVVQGDLKSLKGTVTKVDGNIVTVEAGTLGFLEFNSEQLAKYFATGDNVRVKSGKSKGSCGSVVKVFEDSVVIVTKDSEELKVFKDLVENYVPDVERVSRIQPRKPKAAASAASGASTSKRSDGSLKRKYYSRPRERVVRVVKGPYKGYTGRVSDSGFGYLRLRLDCRDHPVQVRAEDVVDYVEEKEEVVNVEIPKTPMYTPMHPGLRTPMY